MSQKEKARREFLTKAAALGGAVPLVGTVATLSAPAIAQTPAAVPPSAPISTPAAEPLIGYTSFSLQEATFVEALVNHMCPADDLTPSGVDCGLAIYIDRQLSSEYGKGARMYMQGPWGNAKPQHGYRVPMTPEQFFKAGVADADATCMKQYGKGFAELSVDDKETFLQNVAGNKIADAAVPLAMWFNEIVYPLFAQACFADPLYGGNVDKVFWKMVGYPGLPATHTRNIVEFRGKPFPGAKTPMSIVDFS